MAWQDEFLTFEAAIRLDAAGYDHLRAKRDTLLQVIERNSPLHFSYFEQGSYAMATAVRPIPGGDVDIDVGLVFEIDIDRRPDIDPVGLKRHVIEGLVGHTTRGQEIRRNCVTIRYAAYRTLPPVHVDLAVYGLRRGALHLAVGKETTPVAERAWSPSDPRLLIEVIKQRFSGDAWGQFRRVVRYLKRWKDVTFPANSKGIPTGIGLTLAAHKLFVPVPHDDGDATRRLVGRMIAEFGGGWVRDRRLRVELPVAPFNDVFSKMTPAQMATLEKKLTVLFNRLGRAREASRVRARGELQSAFGTAFKM